MVPAPDMIIGGKFRLERPLAKGGMGSVWVGRHVELEVPVAVKFMASELAGTPVAMTRFKREAKAAAQLRSPNVVGIQDYGVQDGAPYMVMELLEGEDLGALLAREKRLSVARVAGIVGQVAKALAMAHAAGIVHRDLKPSNLFLARSGEDEIVKVLDFGVAKEMQSLPSVDGTTSGTLVGSPMYMSPEQARGDAIDFRTDLWSIGVVVYEALVGKPPFTGDHLGALLMKINEANVTPPTAIAGDLPAAIDGFMRRALARNAGDRFASAKALADELAVIARPESIDAGRGISGAIARATSSQTPVTSERATAAPVVEEAVAGPIARESKGNEAHGAREPRKSEASGARESRGREAVGEADARGERGVVGRQDDTLAANEASPVSTTMDQMVEPLRGGGSRRRIVVIGGIAAAAIGVALAGILGLTSGDSSASAEGSTGPGTSGSAGAIGGATSATSHANEPVSGGASSSSTGVVAPSAASTQAIGTGAPKGSGAVSARASTPSATSVSTSAPGTRPVASSTVGPAKSAAPVNTAAPSATAAPATTAFDPTFGLDPTKK